MPAGNNGGVKREPKLWSPVNDRDVNYPYESDTPHVEDDIVANIPADPMGFASASSAYGGGKKAKK